MDFAVALLANIGTGCATSTDTLHRHLLLLVANHPGFYKENPAKIVNRAPYRPVPFKNWPARQAYNTGQSPFPPLFQIVPGFGVIRLAFATHLRGLGFSLSMGLAAGKACVPGESDIESQGPDEFYLGGYA